MIRVCKMRYMDLCNRLGHGIRTRIEFNLMSVAVGPRDYLSLFSEQGELYLCQHGKLSLVSWIS